MNEFITGIKAIETEYKGYLFRSRLKARWAVFFETLGLKWDYQPEGFEMEDGVRFLPDFCVTYPGRDVSEIHFEWFEVKPSTHKLSHRVIKQIFFFSKNLPITILDGAPRISLFKKYEPDTHHSWSGGSEFTLPALEKELSELSSLDEKDRFWGYLLWSSKGRLWLEYEINHFLEDSSDTESIKKLCHAATTARSFKFDKGKPW